MGMTSEVHEEMRKIRGLIDNTETEPVFNEAVSGALKAVKMK